MATKYEAYLGDEMVGKRTTKSRTYTHAVVIQFDEDQARTEAYDTDLSTKFMKGHRRNYAYKAEIAGLPATGGTTHHTNNGHKFTLNHDADDVAKERDFLAKYPTPEAHCEAIRVRRIERFENAVESGEYEPGVTGWCGRLDLAQKLASKNEGQHWVRNVWIVPAIEV